MKGQLLEWFYAKFPARKLYDQSQGHGLFKSHSDLIIACMKKSGWQFYGSWEMAVFFLEHRWVEIISFIARSGQKYGDQIYYKIDAVRNIYVDLLNCWMTSQSNIISNSYLFNGNFLLIQNVYPQFPHEFPPTVFPKMSIIFEDQSTLTNIQRIYLFIGCSCCFAYYQIRFVLAQMQAQIHKHLSRQ